MLNNLMAYSIYSLHISCNNLVILFSENKYESLKTINEYVNDVIYLLNGLTAMRVDWSFW